jgi:hypothetical protein
MERPDHDGKIRVSSEQQAEQQVPWLPPVVVFEILKWLEHPADALMAGELFLDVSASLTDSLTGLRHCSAPNAARCHNYPLLLGRVAKAWHEASKYPDLWEAVLGSAVGWHVVERHKQRSDSTSPIQLYKEHITFGKSSSTYGGWCEDRITTG